MFTVTQTDDFRDWLKSLKDKTAAKAIAQRIVRLQSGLTGDVKRFDGIGELRVNFGPGYRVYFVQSGKTLISCCAAVTSPPRSGTLPARRKWRRRFDYGSQDHPI